LLKLSFAKPIFCENNPHWTQIRLVFYPWLPLNVSFVTPPPPPPQHHTYTHTQGDKCAQFCRTNLPNNITPLLKTQSIPNTLKMACLTTNVQLRRSNTIDDIASGTTAINVFIKNNVLYTANIGDSRAIVAQEKNGKLLAKALSWDQTPHRKVPLSPTPSAVLYIPSVVPHIPSVVPPPL
jgi:hypothetical protein